MTRRAARSTRPGSRGAVVAAGLALLCGSARGAGVLTADDLTDEHVRKAIAAIADELHRRRDGRHFWDPPVWDDQAHGSKYQAGGYTALAVLALLHAGESYQDPRLRGAVDHLAGAEFEGTYAVALRASIWAQLPPQFAAPLARDVQWLLDSFSERARGWDYHARPTTQRQDNSIRQYGVLALWDATKRGVAVDPRCWRLLESAFLDGQDRDGGWRYRDDVTDDPARGSMTAAGLTVLYIVQDVLHAQESVRLSGAEGPVEAAIERGLSWLDRNFSATETPGKPDYFYFYYAYGIERVGLASGRRRFGGVDWYRTIAAEIIRRLCEWDEEKRTMRIGPQGNRLDATMVQQLSFALMFLGRGRVPVAINKLAVPGFAWNGRPRDAANLAASLSRATEAELNWQVVGLGDDPTTWLDAPLLYLAGHDPLPFVGPVDAGAPTPPAVAEIRRLREYIDRGGLLWAANEGGLRGFAASIETLGTRLYPQYEWRDLPDDHWIYRLQGPIEGRRPAFRAISNGVRELIVLSPATDFGAAFQTHDERHAAAWTTASNLYLYASERNRPRPRLAVHSYGPGFAGGAQRTITVARVSHEGNWDPEPAAIDALRAFLTAEHRLDLRITTVPLRDLGKADPPPALAIVEGTAPIALAVAEREALRRYVSAGGVLLFESPGGAGSFAAACEEAAESIFEARAHSLVRHPIITGESIDGAYDLRRVDYRPYALELLGTRETSPRLRGMIVGGAVRVVFSREDLSHALLDQPRWGIYGYGSDTARRMMANLVLYASHRRRAGESPDAGAERVR
jgi:hypothetical protein